MNSYFRDCPKFLGIRKVQFKLVLYLKDNAALWFAYMYEEAEAQGVQLTWEYVQEKLLQRFRPIESAKTARVALASLKQTGSARHYCNLFQQYVTLLTSDMAEADKIIFTFQRGLKPFIAREVDLREPYTLTDAMNCAIRADARNSLLFKRSALGDNGYSSKVQFSHPVPMEVSNLSVDQPEKGDSIFVNGT